MAGSRPCQHYIDAVAVVEVDWYCWLGGKALASHHELAVCRCALLHPWGDDARHRTVGAHEQPDSSPIRQQLWVQAVTLAPLQTIHQGWLCCTRS